MNTSEIVDVVAQNRDTPSRHSIRPPTSMLSSHGNLVSSRSGGEKSAFARPSTAVRAVGFNNNSVGEQFNQILLQKSKNQTLMNPVTTLEASEEINPQIKYRNLESRITKLLESSIIVAGEAITKNYLNGLATLNETAQIKASFTAALKEAKEAFSLDRTLHRFRNTQGENVFHNFDLTYAVFFNLAEQYELNDLHIEALNTYSIMTKNKMFPHVNQLKLNMGNVYYNMGVSVFPKAIKMYRMALDSVPNNFKQLRLKITQNIGILFVRMGQYADAAASFEYILSERADIQSAMHLLLCYYAIGDVEKIKKTFRNLCEIQLIERDNELEHENNFLKLQQHATGRSQSSNSYQNRLASSKSIDNEDNDSKINLQKKTNNQYIFETLKTDELGLYVKKRRDYEKWAIKVIVDLISPIVEENYNDGYSWCIEVIRSSNLSWLASELELNKAIVYLKQNDIHQAIETLNACDREKESTMTASALTNLSFIYINLGNFEMANQCTKHFEENNIFQSFTKGLINKSIIDFKNQNIELAKLNLQKVLQINPNNFEAYYNLGLIALHENKYEHAIELFENFKTKLGSAESIPHSYLYYQLARLQEKQLTDIFESNISSTLQPYLQVLGILGSETDPSLFEKVGSIYERSLDHQSANQYYNEAYRVNPSNLTIATSMGSHYIKLQALEKAIFYLERAVLANPVDCNLMLRVASCFRNSYLPPKQYISMYETIFENFPNSLLCAQALTQVTKSFNMTELYEKYSMEYSRLMKQQTEDKRYTSGSTAADSRLGESIYRNANNRNQNILTEDYENLINGNENTERTYFDPLGPPTERPRTGVQRSFHSQNSEEEMILTDNLLPI